VPSLLGVGEGEEAANGVAVGAGVGVRGGVGVAVCGQSSGQTPRVRSKSSQIPSPHRETGVCVGRGVKVGGGVGTGVIAGDGVGVISGGFPPVSIHPEKRIVVATRIARKVMRFMGGVCG